MPALFKYICRLIVTPLSLPLPVENSILALCQKHAGIATDNEEFIDGIDRYRRAY